MLKHIHLMISFPILIKNIQFQDQLSVSQPPSIGPITGATTTPILPKSVFEEIEIHLPDMKKQKDVVSILYALDRKIELNKQINDNLRASRAQSQTQFELCRGAAVNADVSLNLQLLDRSSRGARVRRAA